MRLKDVKLEEVLEEITISYDAIGAYKERYAPGGESYTVDEDSPEFQEWLQEKVYNDFYDAVFDLQMLIDGGRVNIWREIVVPPSISIEDINYLGIYWSYDPDTAESHNAPSRTNKLSVLFAGEVLEEDVDWISTVVANIHPEFADEQEITLYPGVEVIINDILVDGESTGISATKIAQCI